MRIVEVEKFDIVDYHQALLLMKEKQTMRLNDDIQDTLLILEHPEIVTVGPKARSEKLSPPSTYATVDVDRGGGLTWHGPGQLVLYPIFLWDLDGEASVRHIIHKLEQWVIVSLGAFNITGQRDQRMQGVWVDQHKICSIGLSFLRWVSRHGLTINYATPTGRVEGVMGCGLEQNTTTSLAGLGYTVEREQLIKHLLEALPVVLSRTT